MKLGSLVKILPLSACALTLLAARLEAASVVAKKDGVNITAEAKKDSSIVAPLSKGSAAQAIAREGMFWKVTTSDGKSGYVSVLAVQRQDGEDQGLAGALRDEALKARQSNDGSESTRTRSAVMGVRGLDESKDAAMAGTIRPDLKAVYRMEDRLVSTQQVQQIENLLTQEIENTVMAKDAKAVQP